MGFRRQNSKLLFESPSVASGEEPDLKRFDFDFERKLGDGAFGQVWRVRHKRTSQIYALKQVPKEKVSKMLPQFRREVYIMYEINHPHIIKLYNHFEDEKFFYLIMELAEGNLFHKLYREKHFLERVAAQYFREVLLAVEYLHSHIPAIIHRDIKPENILLDKDGRLKLTDFGWSNYYSSDAPTPRFTTCGTFEYLPPEMVQEKGHDTSADIWCLGILLYEMLIGQTPFKSTLREQMLINITSAKPKFPLSLPQLAKDLVSKMLEKDPTKRPTAITIKEHQWMLDHSPIRPTITQELSPRHIPEFQSPKTLTGYLVISKDNLSSTAENDASPIKDHDIPAIANLYRLSIKSIKDELQEKNLETLQNRKIIQQKSNSIQLLNERIKKIEEKITAKKKELAILAVSEKQICLQISDVNIDLEKIVKYYKSNSVQEKINAKNLDLMEKTGEVKRQQNYLSTLREDLKKLMKDVNEKEKNLGFLQIQLKQIKNDANSEFKKKESKIADKKISQEVLKTRLDNQSKFCKEFGNEEKKTAEEVKKIIIGLMNTSNQIQKLEELVMIAQEKSIEKEQELSNLSYYYEENRRELLQKHRKNREHSLKRLRKDFEISEKTDREQNMKILQELTNNINQSRRLVIEYSTSYEDITNLKTQLIVIFIQDMAQKKKLISTKIQNIQNLRADICKKRSQKKAQIEDIEMQIGILKSALLYRSQFSEMYF